MASTSGLGSAIVWPAEDGTTSPLLDASVRQCLEQEILPDYVAQCRWYGAKDAGRPVVRIREVRRFPALCGKIELCLLDLCPPGLPAQTYFLPLIEDWTARSSPSALCAITRDGQTGLLRDALTEPQVVATLVEAIRRGSSVQGIAFHHTAAFDKLAQSLPSPPPVHFMAAEQSNCSVRVGEVAILKALRKLEPGLHPELEMGRFLTETAHYAHTPPLLGWAELAGTESEAVTLCVMQQMVPNQGDGWSHVLACLREADPADEARLTAWIERLGQRTAELHLALAQDGAAEAFRPEAVDGAVLQNWHEGCRSMARRILSSLRQARPNLTGESAAAADRLLSQDQAVMDWIKDTALSREVLDHGGFVRTRIHGDFHLGQVLVSDDDAFIIDFEGEPMRPLEERRAKSSPLRDVAGMLRSFAYAAASVPETPRGWEDQACAAFLTAYRATAHACPSLPPDPDDAASLLRLFLMEKALYEVGYELANRPDWLPIPLGGVLDLLSSTRNP
ncbi:putative maltokinase [Telmatospirillum sp. J64-1]|uniref:putative maltokinase n=1 Tax=Telmatospirillum sp. J64-1 TaxID=2502183 RepID=UPI00163DC04C|nr:putative maltokinase [Telmatospirillum sp. J64-1]